MSAGFGNMNNIPANTQSRMFGGSLMPQHGGPLMMQRSPSPMKDDPLIMRPSSTGGGGVQPPMEYPRSPSPMQYPPRMMSPSLGFSPISPMAQPRQQPFMQPMQQPQPMMQPQPIHQPQPMMQSQPIQQPQPMMQPQPVMQPKPMIQPQQMMQLEPMMPQQQQMMPQQPMMQQHQQMMPQPPMMQQHQQMMPQPPMVNNQDPRQPIYPQLPHMQAQPPVSYRSCGPPTPPTMRKLPDTAERGQPVWFHAPHLPQPQAQSTHLPQPQAQYGPRTPSPGPHVTQIVVNPDGRRTPPPPRSRPSSPIPPPGPDDCVNCGAAPQYQRLNYYLPQPQYAAVSAGGQGGG